MGDLVGRERSPGASSLVQDAAVSGGISGPGKRTLVEQIPSSGASGGAVVQRQAETGAKPPEETEKVGTSLYAKDDKGNNLPPSIEDVKQGASATAMRLPQWPRSSTAIRARSSA
jgi:hypothetical protein